MTTPLWDDAKAIVQEIKDAMQDPETPRGKSTEAGTHYPLPDQCEKMKVEMTARNYQVSMCTVFHFERAAKIENPTNRQLIIPIQGDASLSSVGSLSRGTLCDIKGQDIRVLTPDPNDGSDILVVTLQRQC